MKSLPIILSISAVAGLFGGLLLGGVTGRNSKTSTSQNAGPDRVAVSSRSLRALDSSPKSAHPRSSDTLESLLTAPPDELYSRLALWLMTADEAEIAAYWDQFIAGDEQPRPILDLIMIGWTRVNPEGAIAAVKGTSYEHFAWWASTCHNPARALAFALAEKTEHLSSVMWGLGEFHPKWVRENWDTLPENSRNGTLPGIVKWAPTDDPMATIDFLKESGRMPPLGMLRYLVRQDPQAAYDWFAANSSELGRQYGSADSAYSLIGQALAKDAPELLDDLIAKIPPGNQRFQLESAAIAQLVKNDPNAALLRARANSDPALATHFMAKIGLEFARYDPDQAFDLMNEILAKTPEALHPPVVRNGETETPQTPYFHSEVPSLLSDLTSRDPARTVENLLKMEDPYIHTKTTADVARAWAQKDVDGLREWVDQNPSKLPESAEMLVPGYMAAQGRVGEALDWSLTRHPADLPGQIPHLFQNWNRKSPTEAQQWLQSADLSADQRQQFDTVVNPTNPNR